MDAEFQNDRIVIRPPAPADITALAAAARESSAEVGRWLSWCHPAYSDDEARAFVDRAVDGWARRSHFPFFVFEKNGGSLVGCVGLNNLDEPNRRANLGYWLRTSHTRRGIASDAARWVCRFGFSQIALTRIEIVLLEENDASRRVAEKLGAKFEGTARNRIVLHNAARDALLYSLLPTDLPAG